MAEPILLDRFRDNSYNQNQIINDKLDFLIGEMRDMKQDIRALDKKIENVESKLDKKIDQTRQELKGDIDKLDKKIEEVRKELKTDIAEVRLDFKTELNIVRWQVIGVVVAQICSIGAIVWAIVSAVK